MTELTTAHKIPYKKTQYFEILLRAQKKRD